MDIGMILASVVIVILFVGAPLFVISAMLGGFEDDRKEKASHQQIDAGKSAGRGIIGFVRSLYQKGEEDLNKGRK